MNWWLLAAAVLVVGSAFAHSLLGEKVVLRRVYRHQGDVAPGQNRRAADDPLTRQTLRLAWHSLSMALFGLAGLLLVGGLGTGPSAHLGDSALQVMSVTFGALAVMSLAIAKGRHVSWMWFAATAVAIWLGAA